jgi:hypothetical protein
VMVNAVLHRPPPRCAVRDAIGKSTAAGGAPSRDHTPQLRAREQAVRRRDRHRDAASRAPRFTSEFAADRHSRRISPDVVLPATSGRLKR